MTKAFAIPFSALLLATSAGAATAATPFDGNWRVMIMTQAGTCDPAYSYALKIDNGQVLNGGDASFAISGKVGSGGAVNVSITRGDKKASGSGRLTANAGSGKWTGGSAGSACSGRWEAQRAS